jgi:hypothetical protein
MCVKKKNDGAGSRMLAEIRHHASRNRYSYIVGSSVPGSIKYWEKSKFVRCNFSKLFGDTYCYIDHHPDNIPMCHVTEHYLRDIKMPWIWPKGFPDCDEAIEKKAVIEKAYEDNWPEKIDKIYK